MQDINWYQVVPALLGGGAFGAIIKIAYDYYASRAQPIGKRVEMTTVFQKQKSQSDLKATISLVHDNASDSFHNLYLANVEIRNKGNKDMLSFDFGLTLNGGDNCVYLETATPDRHHSVSLNTTVNPNSPSNIIDFKLTPFNRKDSYKFTLYIVIPENKESPEDLFFSSPCPVKFIHMPTVKEIMADTGALGVEVLGVSPSLIVKTIRILK